MLAYSLCPRLDWYSLIHKPGTGPQTMAVVVVVVAWPSQKWAKTTTTTGRHRPVTMGHTCEHSQWHTACAMHTTKQTVFAYKKKSRGVDLQLNCAKSDQAYVHTVSNALLFLFLVSLLLQPRHCLFNAAFYVSENKKRYIHIPQLHIIFKATLVCFVSPPAPGTVSFHGTRHKRKFI